MPDSIDYSTKVIIDGKEYFQSPAQSLAKFLCNNKHNGFRFTKHDGFLNSVLYIELLLQQGNIFTAEKYTLKRNIGNLLYILNRNQICFLRTLDKPEKFDINLDNYLAVQYEVFKYLRNTDLIEFDIIERKIRHKERFIYRILKLNALKNGFKRDIKGFGSLFFIPKTDFACRKSNKKGQ